jgi:hypothetical protein
VDAPNVEEGIEEGIIVLLLCRCVTVELGIGWEVGGVESRFVELLVLLKPTLVSVIVLVAESRFAELLVLLRPISALVVVIVAGEGRLLSPCGLCIGGLDMTLNEGAGARCLIGMGAIRCSSPSGSGPGVSGNFGESFTFTSTFFCCGLF